jgi:hypothetical protein
MWTGQRCIVKVRFWTGRRRRQCSSKEGGEGESVVLGRIVEDTVKLSLQAWHVGNACRSGKIKKRRDTLCL